MREVKILENQKSMAQSLNFFSSSQEIFKKKSVEFLIPENKMYVCRSHDQMKSYLIHKMKTPYKITWKHDNIKQGNKSKEYKLSSIQLGNEE